MPFLAVFPDGCFVVPFAGFVVFSLYRDDLCSGRLLVDHLLNGVWKRVHVYRFAHFIFRKSAGADNETSADNGYY